jgi:SAM-dependent methyltransferase
MSRHETHQRVDVLGLYQYAVQDPERQAAVLAAIYRRCRAGAEASTLREDFAGNAADARAWVRGGDYRSAVAVERDPDTAKAAIRAARGDVNCPGRLGVLCGDVLSVSPPRHAPVDVIAALNFSVGYLRDRASLLGYFRHARRCLAPKGVLVINTFGGDDALRIATTCLRITPPVESGIPAYDYLWEVRAYDAARSTIDCRIHFAFPDQPDRDGSLQNAFVYRWRLWSPEDLVAALRAAGFARARAWRHTISWKDEKPEVQFGPTRSWPRKRAFTRYVVAEL